MPVTCPTRARSRPGASALFGAVAAGTFADIDAAIAATRPATRADLPPRPGRAAPCYDRVYAVYRSLYDTLGRTQVELLHELKRIRTDREGEARERAATHRTAGDHAGALRRHDPGITEHQARYAAAVAERLAGVADVRFTRPARNREDVEAITASWWPTESTGWRS